MARVKRTVSKSGMVFWLDRSFFRMDKSKPGIRGSFTARLS